MHDQPKEKNVGKKSEKIEQGFVGSPMFAVFLGIASLALLSWFFAHQYFEPWVWKLYAWIRFYHFEWWETYIRLETIFEFLGTALYFFLVLPAMAKAIIKCRQPVRLLAWMVVPMYLVLSGLYAISQFTVTGRDRLENVLRDIGGTQLSFFIALVLYVVVPLGLIVNGMLLWRRRLVKTKAHSLST